MLACMFPLPQRCADRPSPATHCLRGTRLAYGTFPGHCDNNWCPDRLSGERQGCCLGIEFLSGFSICPEGSIYSRVRFGTGTRGEGGGGGSHMWHCRNLPLKRVPQKKSGGGNVYRHLENLPYVIDGTLPCVVRQLKNSTKWIVFQKSKWSSWLGQCSFYFATVTGSPNNKTNKEPAIQDWKTRRPGPQTNHSSRRCLWKARLGEKPSGYVGDRSDWYRVIVKRVHNFSTCRLRLSATSVGR